MKKFESVSLFTGILLLLITMPLSAEEYYTWVDENGIVNYSERNPTGYDARHVTQESRFGYSNEPRQRTLSDEPAPEAPAPSSNGQREEVDPDALIAEQKAQYQATLSEEYKRRCATATENLARLESYSRMRIEGPDGKMRMMTDREMEDKRQEMRAAIKENCGR